MEIFRHLLVRPGDVILAMDRPVVSGGLKLARARAVDCPCLLVQRVARLRGREGTTDFLYYALSSPAFVRHILVGGQTGTQLPHISGKRIESFQFPLAPEPEQQRIVEAIESYFTRLDDAVATLERMERNLKRYRASVLKSAVEGRLVPTEAVLAKQQSRSYEPASVLLERVLTERRGRWSKLGRKGKYEEPARPDTTNLPELPQGWCWTTVEQLASQEPRSIQSGPFGSSLLHSEFTEEGKLVIGIDNVQDGYFSMGVEHRISDEKYKALQKFAARPGDVLVTVMATIGRTCVVPNDLEPAIITKHVYRVSPDQNLVLSRFLHLCLWGGPAVREQMFGKVQGQTRPGLNGTVIKRLAIPLPPLVEQARILAEADRLLSVGAATQAATAQTEGRLARLRQSILKWAFEGKLADQDSKDEPACALLERIEAERAAGNSAKASGPQRTATKKQVRA